MVDIIGVNHCTTKDGSFSSEIITPEVSPGIIDFLRGKRVGVEAVPTEDRIDLLRRFYFPEGESGWENRVMGIYNPLSQEYFHNIQKIFPESIPLDSARLHHRIIDTSEKFQEINRDLSSQVSKANPASEEHFCICYGDLEFEGVPEGLNPEEAYNIHCREVAKNKIEGGLLIKLFQKKMLASRINDRDRDIYLLDKILNSNLDVAVVGLAHAITWKEKGMPFDYWMDFSDKGVSFQPLDRNQIPYNNQEHLATLDWRLSFGSQSRKKPLYMGLRNSYSPDTFFEITERGERLLLMESSGESEVKIQRGGNRFYMTQDIPADNSREAMRLEYEGEIDGQKITGSIRDNGSHFLLMKHNGTPYEMMEHVHSLPESQSNLRRVQIQDGNSISNPIPEGVRYPAKAIGDNRPGEEGILCSDKLPF